MAVPDDERLPASRVLSHLGVMAAVAAVVGVLVAGLAIPFAGVTGLAARDVARAMDNLPTELKTEALPQRTKILDVHGNTIATLYDENRVNVPLSQISRTMVKAIVAIEDSRFYEHGALDLKGTLRALITNQASDATVQGGSSITQQMVKLTLVSQANTRAERLAATEESYARKIRELRYAIAFEQNYSKDWILERYLNIAYFGDGAFGIQSAARHYFDVNAKDLNLRQSAMLAGMVKNPTGYDPTNSPSEALKRRNVVLDRMAELNVITDEQAAKTKASKLDLHVQRAKNGCVYSRAPFFCDYVLNVLADDRSLGKTVEERKQLLRAGGLTINTTIDLDMQAAADKSVSSHVYPTDRAIGGLAMVEPGTGNLRALAQSRPMGRDRQAGQTFLNYVVPREYGDSGGFQAGSTFKAFVLAAAIKQGIPLNTSIPSPQTIALNQGSFRTCDGNYPSTQVWDVANSTGAGTYNLYTGTQHSVNTFYAQLERATGLCQPYKLARAMGITLAKPGSPDSQMVPSFTLGVANTNPLEMAEAYATFAARGVHCDARAVTSIEDANGNTLKEYPPTCSRLLEEAQADAINDILKGVLDPGGFGYDAGISMNQPDAGKTGTIQNNMAVWFVGYTPNMAAAAMVAGANYDGTQTSLNGQTIGGTAIASAFGSTTAGPIWGDAMKAIEGMLPDEAFVTPDLSAIEGAPGTVPGVGGMTISQATKTLENAGFSVVVSDEYRDSGYSYGTVAYTSPGSGTLSSSGAIVTIYPSTGVVYQPPPPPENNGGGDNGGGNPGDGGGGGTPPGQGGGNPGGGGGNGGGGG